MILHPTVVIGVGSTGKHIVAGIEKYLYEVLNGETLDLFRFLVFETAINQAEQNTVPSEWRTKPVDIKVHDIGAAFYTMKQTLGEDFNWCPPGMHIDGPGAGNKRAGGRLMLLHNLTKVRRIISDAITAVKTAAEDHHTATGIRKLLSDRGAQAPQAIVPALPVPVVLVVGTLAGGTCSGSCVDLGYLIRQIAPASYRQAMFLLPGPTDADKFRANSWAALTDLVYFTENPDSYSVAWVTDAQTRQDYTETSQPGPEPPYKHVYLVTQRDRAGNAHLIYRDSPDAPLLMMTALAVAADLLGLQDLRRIRLANHNPQNRIHNTFLTSSIRGVCYPKYDISEAAACKIIARVCDYWLGSEECYVEGRREPLLKEEVSKKGRDTWNAKAPSIWAGLRATVPIATLARRIKAGQITDLHNFLVAQLTENRQDTIFRAVDQNVENRRREFETAIRLAFVDALQQKQNLKYAEWMLDGVQAEIDRARKYWESIGVPGHTSDLASWQTRADGMVTRLESRAKAFSPNLLGQRLAVIEDELEQIVTRLEMFLMYDTLGKLSKWADLELQSKLDSLRSLLESLRTFVLEREKNIEIGLKDRTGPLLKISRSAARDFREEISGLATYEPEIGPNSFVDYEAGKFTGLLPLTEQPARDAKDRLFVELIDRIQPKLIQRLQVNAPIDIANEIDRQGVFQQAIQRAHATQQLSLAIKGNFVMRPANTIPSLLLTKSALVSTRVHEMMVSNDKAFPALDDEELPFFDHMALFYQEGGGFSLNVLSGVNDYAQAYEGARSQDEATIDPLRMIKKSQPSRGPAAWQSSS
jgi:hypothetical protein